MTKKYAREHKQPDNKTGKQTRSSLFWKVMQHWLVFSYRHFGIAYRFRFQGPSPETPVANYQSTLRNIPEERRPRLHRGGSRKSRKLLTSIKKRWNNNNNNSTSTKERKQKSALCTCTGHDSHSQTVHIQNTVNIRYTYVHSTYILETQRKVYQVIRTVIWCVCVYIPTFSADICHTPNGISNRQNMRTCNQT